MKHALCLLLTLGVVISLLVVPCQAAGGTNGILGHMETMVNELGNAKVLSPQEIKRWQDTLKRLHQKVDTRIQENGGSINTTRDNDLYDEIDSYNKPLFDLYQKTKAKQQAPDED